MGILADEVFGPTIAVGDVAAASTCDKEFTAESLGLVEYRDGSSVLSGVGSEKQPGGSCPQNHDIGMVVVHVGWLPGPGRLCCVGCPVSGGVGEPASAR